jgi:SAM-dependent methyltransferase
LEAVHEFWNVEACGAQFVADHAEERAKFEAYCKFRYASEWHLLELVPFAETKGKSVLEIGTGMGADAMMFASNGAHYTGVDLTETAINTTRKNLEALGLPGRFEVGNAEQLPFADASFDMVYSHGVLHHTPHPQKTFDEVWRVLKPGGKAVIMLYHKHSFNYYVRIMGYMRLRLLLTVLKNSVRARRPEAASGAIQGNIHKDLWERHYDNFRREGWGYLRAKNFVHHGTDGPDCPFAFVFTRGSAREAFAKFSSIRLRTAHFPLRARRIFHWLPKSVENFLARSMGWYLFVFLEK